MIIETGLTDDLLSSIQQPLDQEGHISILVLKKAEKEYDPFSLIGQRVFRADIIINSKGEIVKNRFGYTDDVAHLAAIGGRALLKWMKEDV